MLDFIKKVTGSDLMIITHRIALNLNDEQAAYCQEVANAARFTYNWALARWNEQYQAYKEDNSKPKPSQTALCEELNMVKRELFPWMLKVIENVPKMAIIQLGEDFKNFFAGRAECPQFKKKKKTQNSFTISSDQFSLDDSYIHIPNLGRVQMCESLKLKGKALSATISRTANQWFVSIEVDARRTTYLPKAE